MNYEKTIKDFEEILKDDACFLAGFPDEDEIPDEKKKHQVSVFALHAIKKLLSENAQLRDDCKRMARALGIEDQYKHLLKNEHTTQ